jgi:hypothetical protein
MSGLYTFLGLLGLRAELKESIIKAYFDGVDAGKGDLDSLIL